MFSFWFSNPNLDVYTVTAKLIAFIIVIFWFLPMREVIRLWVASLLNNREFNFKSVNLYSFFDPFGAFCMLLFQYGWCRPSNAFTMVSSKRDKILLAISGSVFNFLSALCMGICYTTTQVVASILGLGFLSWIATIFVVILNLNIVLAVFNLIPVPPLDGFKILEAFIPQKYIKKYYQNYFFINLSLVILMFLGVFNGPLNFLENKLRDAVLMVSSLPFIFLRRL
ncbi:MAG: site-2 protease family protein [Candidatus Improbicoccus devescovinae]|nr:MAG: site-2 protease family protein [Candidatus Improbicoccus devescovinae]